MTEFTWDDVQDQPNERMEFGACHVREAWRRHKSAKQKFLGLERAFSTSDHRVVKLLQEVGANHNAKNHLERGQALYAAVWFSSSSWAILCNSTHATLVSRESVERIPTQKSRNDEITEMLDELFRQASLNLKRPLDSRFFERVIRPVQRAVT